MHYLAVLRIRLCRNPNLIVRFGSAISKPYPDSDLVGADFFKCLLNFNFLGFKINIKKLMHFVCKFEV